MTDQTLLDTALDTDDIAPAYGQHRDDLRMADAASELLGRVKAAGTKGAKEAAPKPKADDKKAPIVPVEEGILSTVGAVAKDVGMGVIETPLQIPGGATQAMGEAMTSVNSLAKWMDEETTGTWVDAIKLPKDMREALFAGYGKAADDVKDTIAKPESRTGSLVRGVSQFLTGFLLTRGAGKAAGIKDAVTTGGKIIQAMLAGAGSDAAFFDPHEQRLSNLVEQYPELSNPVTEYLQAQPDDSDAEGRFKNALEGLALGVLVDGLILGVKAIRAGAKAKLANPKVPVETPKPEVSGRDFLLLGDPEGPLTVTGKVPQPAGMVREAMEKTATEVPDDVAAKGLTRVPAGKGEVYVNFARIDAPDDIQSIIQQTADAFKTDIDTARRGTRTNVQTKLSADQLDAWDVLVKRRAGDPLNAEQSLAARQLWVSSAGKLQEVAKAAAANPSEVNLFSFRKMLATHYAIQSEVIAARTETARALQSWTIPAGGTKENAKALEQLMYQMGGSEVNREMAARVAALANMPKELDAFVKGSIWARTRDGVLEAWVNGLLSGPKTHMVNAMSNTSVMFQQMYERAAAARISQALGTEGGVQLGEATAQLHGMISGIPDALRFAWKTLKTGQTGFGINKVEAPRVAAISSDALGISSTGWLGRSVDVIGSTVRLPGRALQVGDEFFKTVGYRMELHAQALRMAGADVASGKIPYEGMKARIADILTNPPENVRLAAVDAATYQTFTNAPGDFAKLVSKATSKFPALKIVMPFVNTPANIMKYTFERTPLAPLMKHVRADIAAGGARRDVALARIGTGTALMLATADVAMAGHVSGGGPVEPSQKAALMRSGWQPYSVRIGDRYYAYNRLDPIGMTMGIAADMVDILRNTDFDSPEAKDAENITAALAASIANSTMSKTYLSGISDFFEAMADPTRKAEGFAQRLAGSMVPTGVAEIARQNDPYMREVTSMVEAMKRRIPGLSEDLPARRDLWGRPLSYESGLGKAYDMFSPIYSKEYDPEPIDQEILRLEANVTNHTRKMSIDGAQIDLGRWPKAYSRYVELAGNEVKHPAWNMGAKDFLNAVVQGEHEMAQVYRIRSDGTDGGKAIFIRDTINQYRDLARQQILREFPEIAAEVEEKKRIARELKMPQVQP